MKLKSDNRKIGSFSHDTSVKNRKDLLKKMQQMSDKEHDLFDTMLSRSLERHQ